MPVISLFRRQRQKDREFMPMELCLHKSQADNEDQKVWDQQKLKLCIFLADVSPTSPMANATSVPLSLPVSPFNGSIS